MKSKVGIITLSGLPGSGKGTLAYALSNHFNIPAFSMGDMLRKQDFDTRNGKAASLADVYPIVRDLIRDNRSFIFDGFPRSVSQAVLLDALCRLYNTSVTHVIELQCTHDIVISRLHTRYNCSACLMPCASNNEPCFSCGNTSFFIRDDDTSLETIKTRIQEYEQNLPEIQNFYRRHSSKTEYLQVNAILDRGEVLRQIINKI